MLHEDLSHFLNLICLIVKYQIFVSNCKLQIPNAEMILNEIRFIKNYEQSSIRNTKHLKKFNRKWKEYIKLAH